MISKHVHCHPEHDNYGRLASYIADANHEGEKCLASWCAGCWSENDYATGILEVEAVQDLNTRSAKEKTYHLLVSFRPEDEAKLTPEVFKAMEERFAVALGYTEHQRHCGVHKNTGNIHMHIAYNMINPEQYTRHEPFRDFYKLSKVCRELEAEYGLIVDRGVTPGQEPTRVNQKAALVEVHTGQQSFEGYAKAKQADILKSLEAAASWRDVHEALAMHGLEIKPHGNGLVIKDRHSERSSHVMKASALDRSLSHKKLEARFGVYEPPQGLENVLERSRYEATPLQRSPERGTLYAEYRQGSEERKTRMEAVKREQDAALAAIRTQWAVKRREIENMGIAKHNRRSLLQTARKHEIEALAKARLHFQAPREAVRRDVPYTAWNAFLQHKAEHGHETALAVLRSIKEAAEVEREAPAAPVKDWSAHGREQFSGWRNEVRAEYAVKEREVLENTALTGKGKTSLLAVLRMEQLAEEEIRGNERRSGSVPGAAVITKQAGQVTPLIAGFTHSVDRRGIVLFTLPGGGMIRDAGKELFFSAHDKTAEAVALRYAEKKWGKDVQMEGNKIFRDTSREIAHGWRQEQRQGPER